MQQIEFEKGDLNYRNTADIKSSFAKRSVAINNLNSVLKGSQFNFKDTNYSFAYLNTNSSFQQRGQSNIFRKCDSKKYQKDYLATFDGNLKYIAYLFESIIQDLIEEIGLNPNYLFIEAAKIETICQEEGYQINNYAAFNEIDSFLEFHKLIKSLAQNSIPSRFELLISAIVQYANRFSNYNNYKS